MRLGVALTLVANEYRYAKTRFPKMRSMHEGYAIILEEVDELWTAVKRWEIDKGSIQREAVQVAAMAVRLLVDLCE